MAAGSRTRTAWFLAALFAAAFGLRAAAAWSLVARGQATMPDSELYLAYARTIHEGADYRIGDGDSGARRTPGYPAFLAAAWRLAGHRPSPLANQPADLAAPLTLQAAAGAAQAPLVWWLVRRLGFGCLAAWVAGALAAFDPLNAALSGMVLSETVATTALLLAACCWAEPTTAGRALAAGLAAGVALLVRPSVLPLLALAALARRGPWRRTALAAGALAAVCLPWIVRNARVYGRFVPTTLNTGESLYDGWNPSANGGSEMSFLNRWRPPADLPWAAREVAADAHWRREALSWAAANPGAAASLGLEKLRRFWAPAPNAAEFRSPIAAVAGWLWHLPVYALAAAGVAACGRSRMRAAAFLLAPALAFMALHAVFVSSMRYRAPAAPFLDALAGVGAAAAWRRKAGA